ncbi:MAG: glycosyltransferase family 39 protein [Gemmatimonadales bacterium]
MTSGTCCMPAALWTLATMAVLYQIGRTLFDRETGCWAALLYGLFMAWADYRTSPSTASCS